MSNSNANSNHDVFNVRRVRRLVEIMHENNLTEINLQQGDLKIQLKSEVTTVFSGPQFSQTAVPAPVAQTASVSAPSPAPTVADDSLFVFVKSPMVGTFYSSQKPDSPPFVKVGDSVGPETTVCILEAMKVFNEITAECSGKIVAVLAKNGEPVEFGKPLFKIDPKG